MICVVAGGVEEVEDGSLDVDVMGIDSWIIGCSSMVAMVLLLTTRLDTRRKTVATLRSDWLRRGCVGGGGDGPSPAILAVNRAVSE